MLPVIKSKRLKKKEKEAITLTNELKDILVGGLLGDIHGRFRNGKASFIFKQGISHQDYINHLFELFSIYCPSAPKSAKALPHPRTGKIYSSIGFQTYTLPCFTELYNYFYIASRKVIPVNIRDLLTPRGLAYWIADDGSWNKVSKYVTLCTDSYSLAEVEILIEVINTKFNLKCYKVKSNNNYRIIIPAYSIPKLHELLAIYMPPMMKYRIGL